MSAQYLDTWSQTRAIEQEAPKPLKVRALVLPAAGLVAGLDARALSLWSDVSHWQGALDVGKMVAGGLNGLMPKCSDGKQMLAGNVYDMGNYVDDQLHANIQGCYDHQIPCLPYHYFQPTLVQAGEPENDWQYKALKYAMRNLKPGVSFHGLVLDLEEHGETDVNLKAKVQTFYAWLRKDPQFNQTPILFYTSVGYLNRYPALRDWLALESDPKLVWYAQWAYSAATRTSWSELKARWIQSLNMRVSNFRDWKFVQWASSFYGMDGCGEGRIDLNFYHGSTSECYQWLNYQPGAVAPEHPQPEQPPVTDTAVRLAALESSDAAQDKRLADIEAWIKSF
jgi:GH25 family lysozyme M1 (1,4-beta-N-acetylmuramidase)